jgi:hypothetical protein
VRREAAPGRVALLEVEPVVLDPAVLVEPAVLKSGLLEPVVLDPVVLPEPAVLVGLRSVSLPSVNLRTEVRRLRGLRLPDLQREHPAARPGPAGARAVEVQAANVQAAEVQAANVQAAEVQAANAAVADAQVAERQRLAILRLPVGLEEKAQEHSKIPPITWRKPLAKVAASGCGRDWESLRSPQ